MLSGKGAEEFARKLNYPIQPLLTDQLKAIGKSGKKRETTSLLSI